MKFDVITFGSAIKDLFLRLDKDTYRLIDKDFCFSLGSKFFVEDLKIFSGGGGTNTACTFSKQGFKTGYVGKIGRDGDMIIYELKQCGIDTCFVKTDEERLTACSFIFSSTQERTILTYKGASHYMKKQDVSWNKLDTDWFYLANLGGEVFKEIIEFSKKNNNKLAVNPGKEQLKSGYFREVLDQIDILILNLEEAALLTGLKKEKEIEIINTLASLVRGMVVITKGKDGSLVSDKENIYQAGIPSVLFLEKTGAGDAYGSGFVSGIIQKNDIEYAMQLGTANATSCIQKIGAKQGLLDKDEWGSWPKVEVRKI